MCGLSGPMRGWVEVSLPLGMLAAVCGTGALLNKPSNARPPSMPGEELVRLYEFEGSMHGSHSLHRPLDQPLSRKSFALLRRGCVWWGAVQPRDRRWRLTAQHRQGHG